MSAVHSSISARVLSSITSGGTTLPFSTASPSFPSHTKQTTSPLSDLLTNPPPRFLHGDVPRGRALHLPQKAESGPALPIEGNQSSPIGATVERNSESATDRAGVSLSPASSETRPRVSSGMHTRGRGLGPPCQR